GGAGLPPAGEQGYDLKGLPGGSAARRALAERVATSGLVVATVGSTVVAGPSGAGLVGVAHASGLALAALRSVTGPVSGGHANAAVTIATWVLGTTSG